MRYRSLYAVIGLLLLLGLSAGVAGALLSPRARGEFPVPATVTAAPPTNTTVPITTAVEPPTATAMLPVASDTPAPTSTVPEQEATSTLQPEPTLIPTALAQPAIRPTQVLPTTAPSPTLAREATPTTVTVPIAPTRTPPPTATGRPPAPTATDVPLPTQEPERIGGPVPVPNKHPGPRWVTLQAGHWHNENFPEELRHLTSNTGASAAGVQEVDVNVAVARLTARRLQERGYSVEILDATVPVSYTTDLFIALHADGSESSSWRGFKATAPWNSAPESDAFVGFLYEEYGKATGLPTDPVTSVAMADYYAFNPTQYRHALTAGVPATLLEMGFVTNPEDRKALATEQDKFAWGIANAVDRYFRSGVAGPTPSPYPTFTPTKTPTSTPTNTPTSTSAPTFAPTETPTYVPTEQAPQATETAALITPPRPTATPTTPRYTSTPLPTPTPLTGTLTLEGRWLPPRAPNGHSLPGPDRNAAPVLLSDSTEDLPMSADGRETEQVWEQFYMPDLGRPVWKKGPLRYVRQ